jgi:glycosyltransferase involved in cell wall biosynthesis
MTKPRVSIVMLTYNRPQKIGRAIESVLQQKFESWELIVVQDGSDTQTAALLDEWASRDARIRRLARGTVGCIAEASNYGLNRARGEYIAILDDDDYWSDAGKLQRQVEFLDSHPDYVGCGGGYILVDEHGNERGRFLKPELDSDIRARALLANPIGNSTAMFRRVVNGQAALYDEAVKGFADWEFWLAMGTRGKLYNFPEYFAHYALWGGGGSFQAHKVNTRAAVDIVRRHRTHYRHGLLATGAAWLQLAYAYLPLPLRRASYATLSSLKKALARG